MKKKIKNEEELFKGAIFLKSGLHDCETKIIGSPIAVSGMLLGLFKNILERTSLEKADIEILLKIALGEIDKNSKEYDEHQRRLIEMTLKE